MVSILSLHILGILGGRKQIITLVFLYIDSSQILKGNLYPVPSCHTPSKCMYLSHCRSLGTNKTLWIKKNLITRIIIQEKGVQMPCQTSESGMQILLELQANSAFDWLSVECLTHEVHILIQKLVKGLGKWDWEWVGGETIVL